MIYNKKIYLPGLNKQLELFLEKSNLEGKTVLIAGSNSEITALEISKEQTEEIFLIINDNNSFLRSKMLLSNEPDIKVRQMEYQNTDFPKNKFDFIYSQGGVSGSDRNKILKEFKKISKPEGILCIGEIVKLEGEVPQFIKDIFISSSLEPLHLDEADDFYRQRGFEILTKSDFSDTLREFYLMTKNLLKENTDSLSAEEIKFHKKYIAKIKHEADVYLKMGGDQYIGFIVYFLKKENDEKR